MMLKTQTTNRKQSQHKRIIKLFVKTLKQNTLALKDLKFSMDTNHTDSCQKENDKMLELAESVNEKLEIVHKLRNDIKIYRTINTVLTNHYINKTRNHENTIDIKMIQLKEQIKKSYDDLKEEISKMAVIKRAAMDDPKTTLPIHNSNFYVVGNNFKSNQFNEYFIRNEIYNNIIKKIDKLFCGMVS